MLQTHKPSYLHELFPYATFARTLRHNQREDLLQIPFVRTDQYEHSFAVHTARVWNSLPTEIIKSATLESFKSKVHNFLINQEIQLFNT